MPSDDVLRSWCTVAQLYRQASADGSSFPRVNRGRVLCRSPVRSLPRTNDVIWRRPFKALPSSKSQRVMELPCASASGLMLDRRRPHHSTVCREPPGHEAGQPISPPQLQRKIVRCNHRHRLNTSRSTNSSVSPPPSPPTSPPPPSSH